MTYKPEDVIKHIRKSEGKKVKVAITDLNGIVRGKYLSTARFLTAAESGMGFCTGIFGWDSADQPYDNVDFTGVHTGYPDAKINIDLTTYRVIPWDQKIPIFLADFVDNNDRPVPICPRQLLKQIVAQAEISGLYPKIGMELEWVSAHKVPQSVLSGDPSRKGGFPMGIFGNSLGLSREEQAYYHALYDHMEEFEIPLEGFHAESGPGVFEAVFAADNPLDVADRGVLFKYGVKEIAAHHGFAASFMARWSHHYPGLHGHIHQSLWDSEDRNLFYSASEPAQMSKLFRHYVAGQIRCLPELLPLFAPNVNSYKRLEAFKHKWVTWGLDHRAATLRVIGGNQKTTRLEVRLGGADINPYLAIAASLASGIYGIENKLELTQERLQEAQQTLPSQNIQRFPRNLMEATEAFYRSQVARELFGSAFVEHFAKTREWEWREFQKVVTDWELRRYFLTT